ncbi:MULTISPECIES: hypothetical protein [unclassified Paraflavitalea]|uniref:hypothetical protein n=1 Tax=unclassified Paraflavitalea TaxID=2798305 RepID=UPI003D33F16B
MSKPYHYLLNFLPAIPALLLSGWLIYSNASIESCSGLVQSIFFVLSSVLLIVLALWALIRMVVKYEEKLISKSWLIAVSCLVVVGTVFSFLGSSVWLRLRLGAPLVEARTHQGQYDTGVVTLYENNRYYEVIGYIDFSCSRLGEYTIKKDTLFLWGDAFEKSGGVFANSYLMSDSVWVPIGKGARLKVRKL